MLPLQGPSLSPHGTCCNRNCNSVVKENAIVLLTNCNSAALLQALPCAAAPPPADTSSRGLPAAAAALRLVRA